MSKIQRLPQKPLFGVDAKTEDDLETKSVWTQRLLYLLDTSLANENLKKIETVREIAELYGVEDISNMTMGDLMHLQQIIKAMHGDTKAYTAIGKELANAKDNRQSENQLMDPLVKLTEMLYYATADARKVEVLDIEDMFEDNNSNIIEVVIEEEEDTEEGKE